METLGSILDGENIKNIEKNLQPQFDYINKLTKEEKTTLELYTKSWENCTFINNGEFNDDCDIKPEKLKEIQETINNIFEKIPKILYGMVVYRGIHGDEIEKFKKITIYNHRGYISASYDHDASLDFTNAEDSDDEDEDKKKGIFCCLLKITIPSGIKIIPLSPLTPISSTDQKEVLFPLGTQFIITNKYYYGNYYSTGKKIKIYDLTYIPNEFKISQKE